MVPSPLCGEKDRGSNVSSEEGSVIPSLISDMETEKGKGLVRPYDLLIYGEGSSGLKKDEATKQETIRTGQCVPKSKTVPKLQIKSERIREYIQYMKERAFIGKFVGI